MLYLIGSVFCYIVDDFNLLLVGRLIQGLGVAAPYVTAVSVVRDKYSGRDMASVMSLIMMIFIRDVWIAAPFLVLLGGLGGFLVVPMNALLQHRGAALLTAGRSIAVQNFNENGCVLLMMAAYAAAGAAGAPIVPLMGGLGLAVAGFMALAVRHSRRMDAAGPVDVAAQRA